METSKREAPLTMADLGPEGRAMMEKAKDDLLICLIAHFGGRVSIPVKTLDHYPIGRGLEIQHRGDRLALQLVEGPNIRTSDLDGVK